MQIKKIKFNLEEIQLDQPPTSLVIPGGGAQAANSEKPYSGSAWGIANTTTPATSNNVWNTDPKTIKWKWALPKKYGF